MNKQRAAIAAVLAISEAIRELGRVPNGELYARVCGRLDLPVYESIIRTLKNARLVEERANELIWIGPHAGVRA